MPDNNQKVNLKQYNPDYVVSLYNQIYNNEKFVVNVEGDGNCQNRAVIQAVYKKKIEDIAGVKKLISEIRQKAYDLGFRYNDKGECIKNDGVWFDGQEAFLGYSAILNDENFSFTVIKPANPKDIFNVTYADKICSGYKNMFIDLKNGGPAIIAQNKHYKTVNLENRDEFCRKLLELLMSRAMYSVQNRNSDEIKNYFIETIVDSFFYIDEGE